MALKLNLFALTLTIGVARRFEEEEVLAHRKQMRALKEEALDRRAELNNHM